MKQGRRIVSFTHPDSGILQFLRKPQAHMYITITVLIYFVAFVGSKCHRNPTHLWEREILAQNQFTFPSKLEAPNSRWMRNISTFLTCMAWNFLKQIRYWVSLLHFGQRNQLASWQIRFRFHPGNTCKKRASRGTPLICEWLNRFIGKISKLVRTC